MKRTLMSIVFSLALVSVASAQNSAHTPRPKRYDPNRPPTYYWYYDYDDNNHRHWKKHNKQHPHDRHYDGDHNRSNSTTKEPTQTKRPKNSSRTWGLNR